MTTRQIVLAKLSEVAKEHLSVPLPQNLQDDAKLNDFGFDSVAYVALISVLEDDLGFIPEPILDGASFPTTIGELTAMYERAPEPQT